ncbi:hypothetical protein DFR30_2331 [Thiogranum longum]|uniref:Acetyltransferase (GNAT) family protein n=1 Tax=Thiogranum longum TaxID=1537524 RepID=A0A4R1HC77_9GAMM|nr:hypothetical protein [Thiogranum longum]TCK19038.1 hypothetical protein DFR30_2331 [Thiogranum longum]
MPTLPVKRGILSSAVWKLLEYAPLTAEASMDRLHYIASSIANWRVPVIRCTGTHPETGKAVAVIVADNQPSAEHFIRHMAGIDFRTEELGKVPVWKLPGFFTEHGSDTTMSIAHINSRLGHLLFTGKQLHVPECLGTRLTVPDHGEATSRARRSQASNLRRFHRNGLDWEVSRSLDEFDDFYHKMYVPFTLARHGDAATIRSYSRLRNYMLHGGIIWVLHNGRRISGDLFAESGDTLYWICTGTDHGHEEPVSLGATSAIYIFGVQYARQAGLGQLDLGVCRPSLRDGILAHKKRWGAELRPSTRCQHSLIIQWENWSEELAHFLWHTAPVIQDEDGLTGIVSVPDRSPEPEILQKELLGPGIRGLKILDGETTISVKNRTGV